MGLKYKAAEACVLQIYSTLVRESEMKKNNALSIYLWGSLLNRDQWVLCRIASVMRYRRIARRSAGHEFYPKRKAQQQQQQYRRLNHPELETPEESSPSKVPT